MCRVNGVKYLLRALNNGVIENLCTSSYGAIFFFGHPSNGVTSFFGTDENQNPDPVDQ